MNPSRFLAGLSVYTLLTVSLEAAVAYSENFFNSQAFNESLSSVGWNFAYNQSGASFAGNPANSDSVQAPVVSNASGSDGAAGYVYVPSGAIYPYKEEVLLFAEDLTSAFYADINSVSFALRHSDSTDRFNLALKIDGVWYVSDASYGSASDTWASFSVDPMVDTTWKTLTVQIGVQPLEKGSAAMLPVMGELQSVGFYLTTVPPVERTRFDTVSVDVTEGVRVYPDWGGMTPDANGHINTGSWLGWLNVRYGPWLWSYTLERWIYGIDPGASASGAWFYLPSVIRAPEIVATPEFSPNSGTFSSTQSVTISTATSGATIRYTTDGSTPTQSLGNIYSGAISVSSSSTLKAVAYKSGMDDSAVASATFSITSVSGTAYYVDPSSGSMSNPGTASQPWSTLAAVISAGKTFSGGDVIYLRSGNHGYPVITAKNSSDVTITADAGHEPVLNRIDFIGASRWILDNVEVHTDSVPPEEPILEHPVFAKIENYLLRLLNGCSYITLRNCYVNSIHDASSWSANDWNYKAWSGISIRDSSHHITVDGCDIHNVNWGIGTQGTGYNLSIIHSRVRNFCGDGITANTDNLLIEHCIIQDAYETNGNHDDIIQGFACSNVVIRGNLLLSTSSNRPLIAGAQGIGAFDGWFDNWVVENNLVISTHWNAVTLLGARNCRVMNNTVIHNPIGQSSATPWIKIGAHKNGTASSGNYCRNNLTSDIGTMSGTTVSNNIETTNYTSHFVNYSGYDFHLKAGSSAINAGTTLQAPTIDFEGDTRDANPDVGADEF